MPEPEYIPPAKVFSGVSLRSEGVLRGRTRALRSLTRSTTYRIVDERLEDRISPSLWDGSDIALQKGAITYAAHIAGVLGSCVLR